MAKKTTTGKDKDKDFGLPKKKVTPKTNETASKTTKSATKKPTTAKSVAKKTTTTGTVVKKTATTKPATKKTTTKSTTKKTTAKPSTKNIGTATSVKRKSALTKPVAKTTVKKTTSTRVSASSSTTRRTTPSRTTSNSSRSKSPLSTLQTLRNSSSTSSGLTNKFRSTPVQPIAPKKKRSKPSKLIWGILISLFLVMGIVGVVLLATSNKKPRKTKEQILIEDDINKEIIEEENIDTDLVEETEDIVDNTPTPGEVTMISVRQNKYYVILSSSLDIDLAKKFAKEVAADGREVKIIEPSEEGLYYRVAIEESYTSTEAIANLEELKEKYGANIWIMKY